MTFGVYQPCFFLSTALPTECLTQLRQHGLMIKQGRVPNRYVVIFRNTSGLPFIKIVDVVEGVFESGKKKYSTFGSFLKSYRADVHIPSTINPLPLSVPRTSQPSESESKTDYDLIFDPRWFIAECNGLKATELLLSQENKLRFIITWDKSRNKFTYFYTMNNNPTCTYFTYNRGVVIDQNPPFKFSTLIEEFKSLHYTGIGE